MKTNFVKKAAIISCLPLSIMLATAVASMEPEDRLAEDQPLLNRIQNINETLGMKKEQGLKQLAALAAAHAGTGAAYLADYHTARYYLSTKDYSGFVTAVGKFLELKSGFESKQVNMLSTLSTLLNNADASPEIKEKAFALIMPRMGMTPACWNGVAAYLKKLPVDNAQKYDLACRCAEVAGGKNEETQFQLSGLLTLFSAQETQARKVEMYQRYLKICGESGDITAAPEQCLAQVLEWRSKSGDAAAGERLKNLKSRQASDQAASQKEAGNILAILEKGPLKEAIKAVRALQMKPRCLNNDVCLQVAASKAFGSLELSGRLELAAAMFEVMQGEKSASQIYGPLSTPDEVRYSAGYTGAPYFDMLDSYIVHCVSNPNWISSLTGFFRPRVSQFSQEMQPRLYECLTHGQEKLALNDLLAQSLLEKAVLEIDRDENATLADLETVMEKCPQSLEATKAEWLRDMLTGKGKIVQGPLPRTSNHFTTEYRPEFKLNGGFSGKADRVMQFDMTASACAPAVFDVQKVQTDGDTASVGNLFDAKPDTVWKPGRPQAAVQIPFKSIASINQISLNTVGSPKYVVTLLDPNGRALWKGERCLSLHDPLCNEISTVPESVTMNLMPVDNVAYLRLEVFTESPGDGIAELSVKSPKYPALQVDTLPAQTLGYGAKSVAATWTSEGTAVSYNLDGDQESINDYPSIRWFNPWKKSKTIRIGAQGLPLGDGNLGLSFFGDKVSLRLRGLGGVSWSLDGQQNGRIAKEVAEVVKNNKDAAKEFPLAEGLAPGLHHLQLKAFALPQVKDKYSPKDAVFDGLLISGTPMAYPVIRFETAGQWSSWLKVVNGKPATIPPGTLRYQSAVVFDQRAANGLGAAAIKNLRIGLLNYAGGNPEPWLQSWTPPSAFDAVVQGLKERKFTVVYSKAGTQAEYEAAKRLADKAGVYLMSDDKQLNNYPGATLSIGTVLNNRYNRQLLARENIFGNINFLNGGTAWCGAAKDTVGKTDFHFICGPDAASTVAMVDKVADSIPQWREPETAFRLFQTSELDRVYAWNLGTSAPEAKGINVTLARNDRRPAQIGIAFDRQATDIETTCTVLKDQAGHTLPAADVRYVAFYEWAPFFGELRLPDLLVEKPVLPIPANTATGIWLTCKTGANTVPGEYHGELAVRVGTQTNKIPITVAVLAVTVPTGEGYSFDSYTRVPYWWQPGSAHYKRALERLFRNEALHRVTMVTVAPGAFNWQLVNGANVFDFSPLMEEMEMAERVYKEAEMPPPMFMGIPDPHAEFYRILLGQHIKSDATSMGKLSFDFATQLTAQLKKTGRWERYYQKVSDEPGSRMEQWVVAAKPYHDGGLQVHTTNAVNPNNVLASGIISAWCPNYEHDIFDNFLRSRQKSGDRLWWYMCTCPSTRITGELLDSLAFYWLTAKWDFDGGHSYGGMCPPSNGPEATGLPFRYDHGCAFRMVFLPDGTLIDTTRREMESEGIIDCLLIKSAQKKIKGLSGQNAEAYGRRLDAILHSTVPYKRGYAETSAQWEKARADLYRLLADMQ